MLADVHSTRPYSEDNMELRQSLCSMPTRVYNSVKICETMNHRDKLSQSIWIFVFVFVFILYVSSRSACIIYCAPRHTYKHIRSLVHRQRFREKLMLIWKHTKNEWRENGRYKPHLYVKQSLRYNPWCQHAISAFLKGFPLTIEQADHCAVAAAIGAVHQSTAPISNRMRHENGERERKKSKIKRNNTHQCKRYIIT